MKTWKDVVNNTFYVGDQQAPWDVEVVDLDDWKLLRKQYITDYRYTVETSGVKDSNGALLYNSDRVTQSRIGQAAKLFELDSSLTTIQWKLEDGRWTVLSSNEITAMAVAIGQHVQSCFRTEYMLHQQIDAATSIEEVLAINWPA